MAENAVVKRTVIESPKIPKRKWWLLRKLEWFSFGKEAREEARDVGLTLRDIETAKKKYGMVGKGEYELLQQQKNETEAGRLFQVQRIQHIRQAAAEILRLGQRASREDLETVLAHIRDGEI
jgi:hypothetical protein